MVVREHEVFRLDIVHELEVEVRKQCRNSQFAQSFDECLADADSAAAEER